MAQRVNLLLICANTSHYRFNRFACIPWGSENITVTVVSAGIETHNFLHPCCGGNNLFTLLLYFKSIIIEKSFKSYLKLFSISIYSLIKAVPLYIINRGRCCLQTNKSSLQTHHYVIRTTFKSFYDKIIFG